MQDTPRSRESGLTDRLVDLAKRSNPMKFHVAMVGAIVIASTVLYNLLDALRLSLLRGQDGPIADWSATLLSAPVALIVGSPAVYFGYLLVQRNKAISKALRKALEETEIANRSKTVFLANMSHEIRTPLNGILGMAQIMDTEDLRPDQREALRVIGESGNLLMGIIGDVLDLAKIESGHLTLDPKPEPLPPLLRGTVELFRPRAQERGNSLQLVLAEDLPPAMVYDSVRVRQALANLVSNAVKFTKDGKIEVSLSAHADQEGWLVEAHVSDTGIGIAPEALRRLFQPFEQAETSTSRTYGGTGLGLSISRRFARLMGGDISVQSTQGEGSTFVLTFKAGKVAGPLPSAAPETGSGALSTLLRGRRILVVDDSRINRRVVTGLLGPLGPEFLEAEDGARALDLLDTEPVDLVLLDMHMPNLDGPQTLAKLRVQQGPGANVPVIALTADVVNARREDFLEQGFDGYLSKPLSRDALHAELIRLHKARPEQAGLV